jgi:hypothetical protein
VAGHQPPRMSSPGEPPAGPLQPPPPRGPLAGPLRPPAMLQPSVDGSHRAKPQERPPIDVGRLKCPAYKNNNKIYQMKQ